MNSNTNELITRNSIFGWIAIGTGLILLVPLIAMQLTNEVNWNTTDFIVMGLLLFGTGSLYVVLARKVTGKRRVITGVIVAAAFLYLWAELAVGIFTNLGN